MKNYSPGVLVKVREREWVVLPSDDREVLRLKPLGGSEDEVAGIYLPLAFPEDEVREARFPNPVAEDIGDINTARLLYDAARLSFRNGAGPFRSLAKLSFRPRAYQMVPLIMALRQEQIRILIADDVGIGKTIEALLIVKEMLERRSIKRFAVVCLPHLCEQWQKELRDKFDIDAVIIRSNTQARLDREISGDTSVYVYYPYQIISIDYIKAENRHKVFVKECPELVIVDEAHTCARPAGVHKSQQLRHSLIHDIAHEKNKHLIMLTATPHSGKPQEFQSLLGLIDDEYATLDLPNADQKQRRVLARHFVQRQRADLVSWMGENTIFPKREAGEYSYKLRPRYLKFFQDIQRFVKNLISGNFSDQRQRRVHYWTALALMRGVMSSPAAGIEMLENRLKNLDPSEIDPDTEQDEAVFDTDYGQENDFTPSQIITGKHQAQKLRNLAKLLKNLAGIKEDNKLSAACKILQDWLKQGFHPVVFCRYIATANYVGKKLQPLLVKKFSKLDIQVITSEDPDEVRKQRIDDMADSPKRLLVATDCLSEGINLQDYFTAVLHYDLPWNPNRLEQREGRVDRFGQRARKVKTYLLYGADNPIDGVVLRVILEKVREIKKATGISLPFPEESRTILDTVLQSVLLKPEVKEQEQMIFDFNSNPTIEDQELKVTRAIEEAAQRERKSRFVFAQHSIKAQEIETDLREMDEAIGNPQVVKEFVCSVLNNVLGAQVSSDKRGYLLHTVNLPAVLQSSLPEQPQIKISFDSPTPEGYLYLGRNHLFVEHLCQYTMAAGLQHEARDIARAAVVRSADVKLKTTVFLFRARNVIEEKKGKRQLVAEEMLLWGYRGQPEDKDYMEHQQAKELLASIRVGAEMSPQARESFFTDELELLPELEEIFNRVAESRARHLVEAHERFSRVVGSSRYQVVYPVLPMDVLGIYILLPDTGRKSGG